MHWNEMDGIIVHFIVSTMSIDHERKDHDLVGML
jgi:hypothetical protein